MQQHDVMVDNALGRRTSVRAEVELPATLGTSVIVHACTISNLLLGGAQLADAGDSDILMGEQATLRFKLVTVDEWIDTLVIVRWRSAQAIGVQFSGLRAREVWALNQFFRGLHKVAS